MVTHRFARILSLAAVTLGVAVASLLFDRPGPLTALRWVALGGAVGLVVAGLVGLLRPMLVARIANRLSFDTPLLMGVSERSPAAWGVMAAAFAVQAGLLLTLIPGQRPPEGNDQQQFLAYAADIAAQGGPLALPGRLFRGEVREANQHPLYPALLALQPTVAFSRGLSATLTLLATITAVVGVAAHLGPRPAAVLAVLLAANEAVLSLGTEVVCESLLLLECAWLWLLCLAAPGLLRNALMGVVLGLLYLTKGTALPVAVVVVGWSLTTRPPGVGWPTHGRNVAVLLLLAGVVASPLLVRNVRVYGSATYNVNTFLLFADRFEDPVALADRHRGSITAAAGAYLHTHSAAAMAARLVQGCVWELFILARSLGPLPLGEGRALVGGVVLILAAVGAMAASARRPPSMPLGLVAGLVATTLLAFGWYVPIAAGDRFTLPLWLPVGTLAAYGTAVCLAAITSTRSLPSATSDRPCLPS